MPIMLKKCQHCLSGTIEYCTKYVTKSEPRSQSLKDIFTNMVKSLKDGNRSLKAVQKLLNNSVGDRDYSAQETCHLLLHLPMFKASRDFIVLGLDGSRAVEEHLHQEERAYSRIHSRPLCCTPCYNTIQLHDRIGVCSPVLHAKGTEC